MGASRRRFLTLISATTVSTVACHGQTIATKYPIPRAPPVPYPTPPEILQVENSLKAALRDTSEDRPLALNNIVSKDPALVGINKTTLDVAVTHLLWKRDIEEVYAGLFCLIRSGTG
jgi:hypothetical protein